MNSRGVTGKKKVDELVDGLLFRARQGLDALETARWSTIDPIFLGFLILKEISGRDVKRLGELCNMMKGQPPCASFDVRHVGVPCADQLSELGLGHFAGFSDCAEPRADLLI